jgi:hypothetical protein
MSIASVSPTSTNAKARTGRSLVATRFAGPAALTAGVASSGSL